MYIYTYAYIHTHKHTHTHKQTHTHIRICIYIYSDILLETQNNERKRQGLPWRRPSLFAWPLKAANTSSCTHTHN